MKYDLLVNLDSRELEVTDGTQTVGRLIKRAGVLELILDPRYERDGLTISAGIRPYIDKLGAHLTSLADALLARPERDRAAAEVASISPDSRRMVHLGCGNDVRAGWLNIDERPESTEMFLAGKHFLNWDLREGVPVPDDSVEIIYSSHFFEHLTFPEAMKLLSDCLRVLVPGGVFRAMLPDFRLVFNAYSNRDGAFFQEAIETWNFLHFLPPSQRGPMDVLSRVVYEDYTHKYLYDVENFSNSLQSAGFTNIREAIHDPNVDNNEPIRKRYSFYVTAEKPAVSPLAY
jgi:predicted SAM-dependent methyltransferase